MTTYVIRRLLLAVPSVLVVSILVFTLFRLLPGDAALIKVSEGGTSSVDAERYERVLKELGLDRPAIQQYGDWIWGLLRGDGGTSLITKRPVFEDLKRTVPITLELAILALFMGLVISLPIGVVSAVRQNGWWDYGGRLFAIIGLSMPSFLAGSMLLLLMVVVFSWLPPLHYTPIQDSPIKNLNHMIWPALILGFNSSAILARITRSSMLEVLRQDYVRTAWSKGLHPREVVVRHALRNALLPVVTLTGIQFAYLIAGSVIAEKIFVLPGVGSQLLDAIETRDWVVVQTLVMLIAVTVLVLNIVADLLYAVVDPRIRYSS